MKPQTESNFETALAAGERLFDLGGKALCESEHGQTWFCEMVSRLRRNKLVVIKRVFYEGQLASIVLMDDRTH